MATFDELTRQIQERKLLKEQKIDQLNSSLHELNDVVNFRVSKLLKDEFNRICKDDQSTISRELKRYMLLVVKQGRL
ncbi:hypothetical protein [Acinetobacter seifertii]|uniref:hypothetical protein n=1 Tax=Acinetobacter seifertii TaxID=1530123 RepID=UPI000C1E2BA5|nr:hypothetical protein [Acinetobacter seifertii]PJF05464.1 hypothetical protein CVD06_01900 [Acinetobacter seifertii]PJG70675.1 hypothetical protein CVD08_08545 [Acinetobacter seifertii]